MARAWEDSIQGGVTGVGGGQNALALVRLFAGNDGPGAVGLSCEGLVVTGRAALGVGSHCSPQARMGVRVSHRIMTPSDVALTPGSPSGVMVSISWPSVKASPAQWKCTLRSPGGGADLAGPGDEPQPRLFQRAQVRC